MTPRADGSLSPWRCMSPDCTEFAVREPVFFRLETDLLNELPPDGVLWAVAYLCPDHRRISDSYGVMRAYRSEPS